jgi:hypothetical protein
MPSRPILWGRLCGCCKHIKGRIKEIEVAEGWRGHLQPGSPVYLAPNCIPVCPGDKVIPQPLSLFLIITSYPGLTRCCTLPNFHGGRGAKRNTWSMHPLAILYFWTQGWSYWYISILTSTQEEHLRARWSYAGPLQRLCHFPRPLRIGIWKYNLLLTAAPCM